MLRTSPAVLQDVLEALDQASFDHAAWRDQLLRVLSGRREADAADMVSDAHRRCTFGRWYYEEALPELRSTSSFAMIGVEHENQHRIATQMLRDLANDVPIERATIEEFEEASARLSFALYFIRREIEYSVHSRDALTEAHSSGEMLRDLREWHALAKRPGRYCCIALLELDGVREVTAALGQQAGSQLLVAAVRIVSEYLRLTDKVFRYDSDKFLIRLSGTDLSAGKTVTTRLRDAMGRLLEPVVADGRPIVLSTSFGVASLDPQVDVLESIDRANQALTLAKTAGRNRVICWDPSVTTGVHLRRLELKDVPE